ncbi:MAG: hemolysin family protein [Spirochaetaceae bacterium]
MKNFKLIRKLFGNGGEKNAGREGESAHLTSEKQDMIRGVLRLSEKSVKEVMVPRIDTAFIGLEYTTDELIETIDGRGFSRFPVYKDTIDNVVGILYAKDLIKYLTSGDEINIERIIRKPYFVPESKRLDSLLREMRRKRVHIAVAVDEYGGVSGIVCLEDIIEEIVGDIQDEFDNEHEDILEIGENVFLCDARVDIGDLNEELGLDVPDEDFDTLGGFVFDLFGRIPVRYEKVGYRNLEFIIQEMDGHKIKSVKLVVSDAQQEGEGDRRYAQ